MDVQHAKAESSRRRGSVADTGFVVDQLFEQLRDHLGNHSYPELRQLEIKTDGHKLLIFGFLGSYYMKQILVSTTRPIRRHISVEYDVVIR